MLKNLPIRKLDNGKDRKTLGLENFQQSQDMSELYLW